MRDLSDPISRQQTITALRALSDEDGYINVPHEVVTDVVRGLPPVQLKHEQITHSERGKTDKLGVKTGETCEDCISRQAAIDAVCKDCEYYYNENVIQDIKDLPSAPERKTSTWHHYEGMYTCNQCGATLDDITPFCPLCGADMRGEVNG